MQTTFLKGHPVHVNGWGLSGIVLIVAKRLRGGFYDLTFANNGNAVPSHYHRDLLSAA